MAGFSDVYEVKILDVLFGKATLTSPACWLTIATAAISDADTGSTLSEPTSGTFARARISALGMGSAASGVISNSAVISFVAAASAWGSITHFAICDASVAGNVMAFCSVQTAKSVASDDTVYFDVGALKVYLS